MNKHDRRELRLRQRSAAADKKVQANARRDEVFSHHSMFDALPTDLDSLLRDCFADRAWRPDFVKPSPFGYLHLIDERPVGDVEHETVCRTLFAQLKAIVEWCRDHQINLQSLVHAELDSLEEFYQQRWVTPPNVDPYRTPDRLLDIVEDLIDGDDTEAFDHLLKLGKTVPVAHTMSKLRVGIDAVISGNASTGEKKEPPMPSPRTEPNAAGELVTAEELVDYFKKMTGKDLTNRAIRNLFTEEKVLPVQEKRGNQGALWSYATVRDVLNKKAFKREKIEWPKTFRQSSGKNLPSLEH